MNKEQKGDTYYPVPANVNSKFEIIDGIGWYELKIIVIACLIGTIIFFVLGIFKKTVYVDINNAVEMTIGSELGANDNGIIEKKTDLIPSIWRAFAIIIPGTIAFFAVKKDPHSNLSLISLLKNAKDFSMKQKLYLNKYNSGSEEL